MYNTNTNDPECGVAVRRCNLVGRHRCRNTFARPTMISFVTQCAVEWPGLHRGTRRTRHCRGGSGGGRCWPGKYPDYLYRVAGEDKWKCSQPRPTARLVNFNLNLRVILTMQSSIVIQSDRQQKLQSDIHTNLMQ